MRVKDDKLIYTDKPSKPADKREEKVTPPSATPTPKPAQTSPQHAPALLPGQGPGVPPGVARGLKNEFKTLVSLHDFGWLTARQISELVWPDATYGKQMAYRVLDRMLRKRLVVERHLPNGTSAWVLSTAGAQQLRDADIDAKRGTDQLRADDSTWLHRWQINEFLIAEAPEGVTTYSEFAILAHRGPLPLTDTPYGRLPARQWLGKVPDALWSRQEDGVQLLTWIEVERTRKRSSDLRQLCEFIVRGMHQPQIDHSRLILEQIILFYPYDSQRPETRALVYPLIRALLRGLRKAYEPHFADYAAPEIYAERIFESVYLVLADVGSGPTLREVIEGWRLSELWLDPDLNSLKEALGVGTTRKSRRR